MPATNLNLALHGRLRPRGGLRAATWLIWLASHLPARSAGQRAAVAAARGVMRAVHFDIQLDEAPWERVRTFQLPEIEVTYPTEGEPAPNLRFVRSES